MEKMENINGDLADIKITVIYDNNPMLKELETDWGFACLIELRKNKILFDTGELGKILSGNMEALFINPKSIDTVVLSHFHHDHTGGLKDFLAVNPKVIVYYPKSFPVEITDIIKNSGAISIPVADPMEIMPDVYTIGEIEGAIPEQSLAIRSAQGIIVITGCAHPGIVNILQQTRNLFPKEIISLAVGGFHFFRSNEEEIDKSVNKIFEMGVRTVAPTHCTGNMAREKFKNAFKNNYIEAGAGKTVTIGKSILE